MTNAQPERIYLDYNATSPCRDKVIRDMLNVMKSRSGNPSSLHWEGQRAKCLLEESRDRIATALGATPSEIVFTSGGTESDNFAVFGVMAGLSRECPHVITSNIEHPALLESCRAARSNGAARATFVKCETNGRIHPDSIAAALEPDTALVSIMHANNETGTIQPIHRIAEVAHENDVLFHSDAVQTLGRIPLNVDDLGLDLMSISSHKLGGPGGTGALYVRKGTRMASWLFGGPQERERRAGTEHVAGIVGFAAAVELAVATQPAESGRLARIRSSLWEALRGIPGIRLNSHISLCLPNTLNVSFKDVSGEELMQALDLAGFAVSTGSACAAGAGRPSYVLEAMGVSAARDGGPLRISMGYRTTEKEAMQCAEGIREAVSQLRKKEFHAVV